MMSKKTKKFTSFVMAAVIGLGVLGSSGISEAASHRRHVAPPPHHYNHHDRRDNNNGNKKYSEGERNTAAILGVVAGAVIGTVIANNNKSHNDYDY